MKTKLTLTNTWTISRSSLMGKVIGQRSRSQGQKTWFPGFCKMKTNTVYGVTSWHLFCEYPCQSIMAKWLSGMKRTVLGGERGRFCEWYTMASSAEVIESALSVCVCVCVRLLTLSQLNGLMYRHKIWCRDVVGQCLGWVSWLRSKVKSQGRQLKKWFFVMSKFNFLPFSNPISKHGLVCDVVMSHYDVVTSYDVTWWRCDVICYNSIPWCWRACTYGMWVSIHHGKRTLGRRNFTTRVAAGGASTLRRFHILKEMVFCLWEGMD